MTTFAVCFDKQLSHWNVPDQYIQQGLLVVDGRSASQAVECAKELFARSHNVSSWTCHADRIRVTPMTPPPAQATPLQLA